MLFDAKCPRCKQSFQTDTMYVGTKRTCAGCGAQFVLERPRDAEKPRGPEQPKVDKGVQFDTTCRICRHVFSVDAAFAGARRTCPKCGAVFVLELPAAVRAQVEARKERLHTATPREFLGCAACLHVSTVPLTDQPTVRCAYCGAPSPAVAARALAVFLERVDAMVIAGLLAGANGQELVALVKETAGAPADAAELTLRLAQRAHPTLPQTRCRALEARNRGEPIRLGPPPICDRCLASQALTPLRLLWERVEEESTHLHAATAITIFAGTLITEKRKVVSRLEEVAYLCQACARQPRPPVAEYTLSARRELPPL